MTCVDGICFGKLQLEDKRDAKDSNNSFVRKPAVTARLPTDPNATHYNMNHQSRGHALIFNHESFKNNVAPRRDGTNRDADMMAKCVYDSATKINYSDCDCFVMVVLTHGNKNGVLQAYDKTYDHDDLWKPFSADRCPTLAGKPKLFFIQACRGVKLMPFVNLIGRTQIDGPGSMKVRIPSKADFLFAYSNIPGYYSWRSTSKGSWFIQSLCQELEENAYQYDILTILTIVNRRVALDYESWNPDDPEYHERKQISCFSSRLIRLVKFNKKSEENKGEENIVVGNEKKKVLNIRNTTPKKETSFDY